MNDTIYQICMSYKDKQADLINPLVQEAPLFQTMVCMEASTGPINTFEKVKDVTIPQIVEYDAPLPVITVHTELGYATIGKVGGRLNLPLDKVRLLGKEAILAKELPPIFNLTGQAYDYSYTYNSLKAYCLENKEQCVTRIATTGDKFYSMIGVTWAKGQNCGLYQPALSGERMFNITPIGGGQIIDIRDKNGNVVAGYAMDITMFLGIQIPRPDRIHALVNINDSNLPTYKQLLDFVSSFGGYTDNSYIYCHPLCLNAIVAKFSEEGKHADLIKINDDGDVRIGKCRIIANPNMAKGTEALVTA